MALRFSGGLQGDAPRKRLTRTDDGPYETVLDALLEPVVEILLRSGVTASLPWGGWRWGGRESALPEGWYLRALRLPLRETRSRARLGELEVGVLHRHDRWELAEPPHLELHWR